MKKGIVLIMVLTIIAIGQPVFAGGGQEEESGTITLQIWSLFGGSDSMIFQSMIDQFNASQDEIEVVHNITDWEGNYYGKLKAAISGGNAPDIAIIHTRNLPEFADDAVLNNITDLTSEVGLNADMFQEIPWNGSIVNGTQYGVPLDIIIAMVLYYNKDYFEAAGIDAPPATGDELIAVAHRIQDETDAIGMYVPIRGFVLYRYWYSLLHQFGGEYLTDDLSHAAFDSPEGVRALQYLKDMIVSEHIASETDLGIQGEAFRLGRVAMAMDGIWHSAGYKEQSDLDFGVASIPAFGIPGDRSFFSNSHNFVFPRNTQTPESEEKLMAALEFVRWMSDNSIIWGTEAGMLPARLDVVESPEYQAYPLASTLLEQAEYATYPPQIATTSELQTIIISALESVMSGNEDPETALASAARDCDRVLSE